MKMQTKKPGKIKSAILNWLGVPGTLTDPEWWAAFGAHSDAGQNVTPDSALKLSGKAPSGNTMSTSAKMSPASATPPSSAVNGTLNRRKCSASAASINSA